MAVQEVNESNFDDAIKEGVVMVDFWAPWCGPCRMVAPILDKLQDEMEGKVKIIKVNVDENPSVAQRYGISSIPTMIIFKNGEQVDHIIGASTAERYKGILEKHLS